MNWFIDKFESLGYLKWKLGKVEEMIEVREKELEVLKRNRLTFQFKIRARQGDV